MKPLLIVLEGIDGSGITTHARLLAERLRRLGVEAVYEKEPSSGPVGRLIRGALQGREPLLARSEVLALLFAADRFTHLYGCLYSSAESCVMGHLSRGTTVVMDRYKYSSMAYQSAGQPGLGAAPRHWVGLVNAYAPPPHVLVYIDVPVEVALERIAARSRRELTETRESLQAVKEAFEEIMEQLSREPEHCPHREPRAPWERLLDELAPGLRQRLYPPNRCYPLRVARVRGVDGRGEPRSIEDVSRDIMAVVAGLVD